MNFLKNPTSEALYFAQIVVSTLIGVVVIVLSCRGYRQTRFTAFVLWIIGSFVSVAGTIGWDIVGHAYSYPRLYPSAVIGYRCVFLLNSVVSAIGTIMIIREFMRISQHAGRK